MNSWLIIGGVAGSGLLTFLFWTLVRSVYETAYEDGYAVGRRQGRRDARAGFRLFVISCRAAVEFRGQRSEVKQWMSLFDADAAGKEVTK